MNVVIIEDEIIAAKRMIKMLEDFHPSITIVGQTSSVEESIELLKRYSPDLIFMDIQLSDGTCFEIFDQLEINTPIIFTTAYNEFALKAFKVNSVDYLLKPIDPDQLNLSLRNFQKNQMTSLAGLLSDLKEKDHKTRFLVKSGQSRKSICIEDIKYFYSSHKLTYLVNHEAKKFVVEYTLDELSKLLDPKAFIKINRNFIVSHNSVIKFDSFFNNRYILELSPPHDEDIIVSRFYSKNFKNWMDA